MLRNEDLALALNIPCKNEQSGGRFVQSVPTSAILMDALRSFEIQLQKRGMIDSPNAQIFNPIWFVAETERNVFLWRRGCSLIQQDEFEFWIDIDRLIEKRVEQLINCQSDSPFVNPLWGVSVLDKATAGREVEYLKSLQEIISKADDHLHALSRVSSMLQNELVPGSGEREIVVLPAAVKRTNPVP